MTDAQVLRMSVGQGGRPPAGCGGGCAGNRQHGSVARMGTREERFVHLALDPRYFEQAHNRDCDYQRQRDEIPRNHDCSVLPFQKVTRRSVGNPRGLLRHCIKTDKIVTPTPSYGSVGSFLPQAFYAGAASP